MLKKKIVKDRETRIKFACLAITSSILFPSSHTPRLIPEHVEMIRDLNEFLAYPWDRAAYLTLITSITSKDEIALSQPSVAIRGYVDAIQLVLIAPVPKLKEEITQDDPVVIDESESDGETPDVVGDLAVFDGARADKQLPAKQYCLIPGHAKSIDAECQVSFVYSVFI